MLIIRPIASGDLDALVDLARELDSVNLPSEPDFLARRIEASIRSFAGDLDDWREGSYVFMLEDTESGRCVGTSAIFAKLGRPGAPYFWLAVTTEERRSDELDAHFVHTKLQLHSTEDGPTEIGGIILDPAWRGHPAKCGKALSIVRFAFMSLHPDVFERDVVAEMLSPFESPGRNLLWDAFGAKFTGLPFREADHMTATSKQFIADLFPRDPVYVTLFPEEVQTVIGRPNDTAVAAVRILDKVGFQYLHQVDPFDGGPYYGAARNAISTVRERRDLVLPGRVPGDVAPGDGPLALLCAEAGLGFRATVVPLGEDGTPRVPKECREALGVAGGDRVSVAPLP